MTTEQTVTKIQTLSAERDWRYFGYYVGYVQTLGHETAGEMIARMKAADIAAATETTESAIAMRDTYLNIIIPSLPDTTDGRRALGFIYSALRFCPRVK